MSTHSVFLFFFLLQTNILLTFHPLPLSIKTNCKSTVTQKAFHSIPNSAFDLWKITESEAQSIFYGWVTSFAFLISHLSGSNNGACGAVVFWIIFAYGMVILSFEFFLSYKILFTLTKKS